MSDVLEKLVSQQPNRIVFAGDSITHGALHTKGWRDYVELFSERLRQELKRPRDMVIKTGVSGWKTENLKDDLEWNILQFEPHVVSLMFGINDSLAGNKGIADFKNNYNHILDQLEKRNSLVILNTVTPIFEPAKNKRAELHSYANAICEVALERGIFLIDHYSYWQKTIGKNSNKFNHLMNDDLHPNGLGHCLIARLLFDRLKIWDPDNSATCKSCMIRTS